MEIARRENITPADALLSLVQSAMGRVAYVDSLLVRQMQEHIDSGGDPAIPPFAIRQWMKESRQERLLAARTAKSAVDAGVMAVLAQRLDVEGALVADALTAALDVLELESEDRMKALGAAHERLMNTE